VGKNVLVRFFYTAVCPSNPNDFTCH